MSNNSFLTSSLVSKNDVVNLQAQIDEIPKDETAWQYFVSTNYTPEVVVGNDTTVKLLNNGAGVGGFSYQGPRSGWNFWNSETSLIEPEFEGDSFSVELRLDIQNSASSGAYFDLKMEIGSGTPIVIPLGVYTFPKGAATQAFATTKAIFCADTFKASGGTIFLTNSGTGTLTIKSFGILLVRTHKGR